MTVCAYEFLMGFYYCERRGLSARRWEMGDRLTSGLGSLMV